MKSMTKIRIFFLLSIACGGFLSGMRSFFLFSDFSFERQHFATPIYELVLLVAFALSLLLLAVFAHSADREADLPVTKKSVEAATHIPLILLHIALVTYDFMAVDSARQAPLEMLFLSVSHLFFVASGVLGILSLLDHLDSESGRLISRAIPALGASFYAMYLYFESYHFMNNPNLLLLQIGFLSLSVYEVTLARAELAGRIRRRFVFVSGAAAAILLMTSVPSLLYTLLRGDILVTGIFPDLLLLFSAIRILAVLFPALFPKKEEQAPADSPEISESEISA